MNNPIINKAVLLGVFIVFGFQFAQTQNPNQESFIPTVTIEECYDWARENFPIARQLQLIEQTTQYNLSSASTGNLPQLALNGQATYQSAVTELPIDIPNMEIPTIDNDQYKVYGELYQPLTNFGNVNAKKKIIENAGEIEKQQIEIELYKVKNRINQIYFGILLLEEKNKQLLIIQSDLDSTLATIDVAIENGTATIMDRQILVAEKLSFSQQIDENKANQKAFLQMLAALTGKNITQDTKLSKPTLSTPSKTNNRPELQLFTLQSASTLLQTKQVNNSLMPNIGLFVQGGYGRPALNFLSNEFEFYYIGGVKFNWNISSLYNYKNTKRTIDLTNEKIRSKKETFLLNIQLDELQQSSEIDKYQQLIKTDYQIVEIRENVLELAKVQLENGLITTLDYIKFVNELQKAQQTLILHETQQLLAQYNMKYTTGN